MVIGYLFHYVLKSIDHAISVQHLHAWCCKNFGNGSNYTFTLPGHVIVYQLIRDLITDCSKGTEEVSKFTIRLAQI